VTIEIKTGVQRVITYFLSPLLRLARDSLHKRGAEIRSNSPAIPLRLPLQFRCSAE
jgi:hypothetical protein